MKLAQDSVKADPKHYKIEFENDQVRVLRINYGPREKSAMHEHPNSVAIFLTEGKGKFNFPNGEAEEFSFKLGQVMWHPAMEHLPESLSDKPFQIVLVELKVQ